MLLRLWFAPHVTKTTREPLEVLKPSAATCGPEMEEKKPLVPGLESFHRIKVIVRTSTLSFQHTLHLIKSDVRFRGSHIFLLFRY